MPGSPLEARIRRRLADLDAAGLRRTLRAPTGIDFSSNDYLGLARHPAIAARLIEAIRREGCGSTGSRLIRGERDSFDRVERRFAEFKGTARALYFSSGYLANVAVLSTLVEDGDLVLSDASNHASLIDGMRLSRASRLVFPHNDTAAVAELLRGHQGAGHVFVVTESVFSMEGDAAPLAAYAALCQSAGATLVVDEAHAVGVYGARGSGLLEATEVGASGWISINAAGKALGVGGAFVAGPEWAIEYLVQRGRPFIFSTAAPPALAEAIDASLDIVAGEPDRRARLARLAARFRSAAAAAGVPVPSGISQIVPVLVGDNERTIAVARALQDAGFDVRGIRPPTVPPGTGRLRVSINAGLADADIDRFVPALAGALKEAGVCSAEYS